MQKISVEYDIEFAAVGSNSATGYLFSYLINLLGPKRYSFTNIIDIQLTIKNMTTRSNLEELKAFIEDLIYLERMGVTVILSNNNT